MERSFHQILKEKEDHQQTSSCLTLPGSPLHKPRSSWECIQGKNVAYLFSWNLTIIFLCSYAYVQDLFELQREGIVLFKQVQKGEKESLTLFSLIFEIICEMVMLWIIWYGRPLVALKVVWWKVYPLIKRRGKVILVKAKIVRLFLYSVEVWYAMFRCLLLTEKRVFFFSIKQI